MSTGVIYLLTSMKLASRLMVSIYSLRKWYPGPITVFTTKPKAHEFAQLLAADPRLRVDVQKCRQRPGRGYQAAYLTKTEILQHSPYEATIFLDADTVVVGNIDELVENASSVSVTATHFCGWTTHDDIIRRRIERWRPLAYFIDSTLCVERLIEVALSRPVAAVNSGVFAVLRNRKFVQQWTALTRAATDYPFPDEVSLQLLLPTTDYCLLGSHFNAHPYSLPRYRIPRIWHFAGFTHLKEGCAHIWLREYQECFCANIAGIARWPSVTSLRAGMGEVK